MNFKGIIFDFNGTLLLDSPLHEEAWIAIAAKLRSKTLSVAEFQQYGHGRTNKAIISYLLGREPEPNELEQIIEEKESRYRNMCLNRVDTFSLAPGVIPFLNELKLAGIPITIATGSYAPNVEFYFKHLNLDVWFDRSRVVLDDGTYPGKPAPDIFRLAAQMLGLAPGQCLVFEDSYSGIQAALVARVAKIIAVEPALEKSKIKGPLNELIFCSGFSAISLDYLKQI